MKIKMRNPGSRSRIQEVAQTQHKTPTLECFQSGETAAITEVMICADNGKGTDYESASKLVISFTTEDDGDFIDGLIEKLTALRAGQKGDHA